MRLLTFCHLGKPRIGLLLEGDLVLDLVESKKLLPAAADIPNSVLEVLESGDTALNALKNCLEETNRAIDRLQEIGAVTPLGEVSLLPPIVKPGLILSVGLNYWKHLEEMENVPTPKYPSSFIKAQSALLGSGRAIEVPTQCANMIDYEGEFCVVIGKECHRVPADEAMDYVVGYTIANDVSARDWVSDAFAAEGVFPVINAWERNINGKQLPGFLPCGPVLVTKDEIPDPHNLYMETRLNGEVKQSTSTNDMIFKISEIIAYYSQWYRFHPGDILTTGSPAGVAYGRDPQVFMKPGDLVEVEVEGIGILNNYIVSGS